MDNRSDKKALLGANLSSDSSNSLATRIKDLVAQSVSKDGAVDRYGKDSMAAGLEKVELRSQFAFECVSYHSEIPRGARWRRDGMQIQRSKTSEGGCIMRDK